MKQRFGYLFCLALMVILWSGAEAQTPQPTTNPTPYATAVPLPNLTRGELAPLRASLGLKVTVVAGAAADTNIAIAGLATSDTLLAVLEVFPPYSAAQFTLYNRLLETKITSAGNIQLNDTDSTGNQLLVIWYDHDAYSLGQ